MGWWEASEGQLIGDDPLDEVENFLTKFSDSYIEGHGRKPTLDELLECMRLLVNINPAIYLALPENVEILSIKAKTKTLPKRQKLMPGSIFCVPLNNGFFAFGKMTPQSLVAEFFMVKSKKRLNARTLQKFSSFRYKTMIPDDAFRKGHWIVYDKIDFPLEGFMPTVFRIGNKICCGTDLIDGFIETSTTTRLATDEEMKSVSPLSISNISMAEWNLEHALVDAPVI